MWINILLGVVVLVMMVIVSHQRKQIELLQKDSAYWENQTTEARHQRYAAERRLIMIGKICGGEQESK